MTLFTSTYLFLKADQLRQVRRPGGPLTQAVQQPYGVSCLTGQRSTVWQYESHKDDVKKYQ